MNDEIKQLVEDAARLLGLKIDKSETNGGGRGNTGFDLLGRAVLDWHSGEVFYPLDPERGDLMKVAMAAELVVNHRTGDVYAPLLNLPRRECEIVFKRDYHNSLAIAILRAASAVWKARGGE